MQRGIVTHTEALGTVGAPGADKATFTTVFAHVIGPDDG
jgi:ABC-type polysaccharide/polyol phosphate transport system ATPase subunit